MKRKILISLAILLAIWLGYRGYMMSTTRSHSPAETVNFSYKDLDVQVTYGRPYKKGRVIFGEAKDRSWLPKGKFWTDGFRALTGLPRTTGALVPYGKYWRLGANDATEVSFNKNIDFAGRPVNAGRYRMYAVPNHDSWNIRLNSELGKFGYNEPNYSLDVVTVDVPVETTSSELEQFTISFDTVDSSGVKMIFKWDRTLVRVPLMVQGNL
jgi:hypothetical protein